MLSKVCPRGITVRVRCVRRVPRARLGPVHRNCATEVAYADQRCVPKNAEETKVPVGHKSTKPVIFTKRKRDAGRQSNHFDSCTQTRRLRGMRHSKCESRRSSLSRSVLKRLMRYDCEHLEGVNTIHPEPEIHEQIYMTKGYGTLCTTTSTFSLTLSAL